MESENGIVTIRAIILKDGKEVTVEQPLEETDVDLCSDEELNELFSTLIKDGLINTK